MESPISFRNISMLSVQNKETIATNGRKNMEAVYWDAAGQIWEKFSWP